MIEPLTTQDALYVCYHMRDVDLCEIRASSGLYHRMDFARMFVQCGGWCLKNDAGVPVVVCGVHEFWDGVGNAWMVGTEETGKHIIEASRHAKKVLSDPKWRRVQAWSAAFHTESHAWLEMLGFVNAHTLEQYGTSGERFYLFERLRGM